MNNKEFNEENLLEQLHNLDENHIDIIEYGPANNIFSCENNRYRIQKTNNGKYCLSIIDNGTLKNIAYPATHNALILCITEHLDLSSKGNWIGYVSASQQLKSKKQSLIDSLRKTKTTAVHA
jgi:uncharacterized membrane protein